MNGRAISALLFSAAVTTACGVHSRTPLVDDAGVITVHCNSSSLRWNACYDTAANLCGQRGYQILSGGEGEMPSVTTNAYEVPVIGESMRIRCNQ